MPRFNQREGCIRNQFRHVGVYIDGKKGFRTHKVYLGQESVIVDQQRHMRPKLVGERSQYADNLPPHLKLEVTYLIVKVEYFLRLDKSGLPCRSEERSVGRGCVSKFRSRWLAYH